MLINKRIILLSFLHFDFIFFNVIFQEKDQWMNVHQILRFLGIILARHFILYIYVPSWYVHVKKIESPFKNNYQLKWLKFLNLFNKLLNEHNNFTFTKSNFYFFGAKSLFFLFHDSTKFSRFCNIFVTVILSCLIILLYHCLQMS